MPRAKIHIEVRRIPVDLVNDPKMLVRESMGTELEIHELADSIAKNGQLQPILVKKVGERYDLIVGHRRLYVHRLRHMPTIEAKIIDSDVENMAIMRYHENSQRKDIEPYEEAVFLQELLDNIGVNQSELAQKIGKSSAFVAQRLAILRGYPKVRDAIREGLINFNQCRELMLMPDEETANSYLAIVLKGGAKADLIRSWRNDIVIQYKKIENEEVTEEQAKVERDHLRLKMLQCELCHIVCDPAEIRYIKSCAICHNTLMQQMSKLSGR